jgi:DNA polymerase III subunit chi
MTRVSFYLLAANAERERHLFACRLARKAFSMGHRVHIRTPDAATTAELDALLWSFEDTAFLPHGTDVDDPAVRITLHERDAPREACDVLINLAAAVPEGFGRFERVADVVGGDAAARAAGRERYRFYRDRGYPLEHHEIDG